MNAMGELRQCAMHVKQHVYTHIDDIIERLYNEYMELPRDCNDRPIHVGDTVLNEDESFEVAGISSDGYVIVYDANGCGKGMFGRLLEVVPPDDVERATCHIESTSMDETAFYYNLSCGHTLECGVKPQYCYVCGAKVVD